MTNVAEVSQKFGGVLAGYERKPERMRALLGDTKGVVQVAGRSGYCHIHLEDGQYFGVVFNAIAPLENNLPVIVGYSHGQPELFQVLEASTGGSVPGFAVGAAGSYTNANITVDAGGHVVAASSGMQAFPYVTDTVVLSGQVADIASTELANTDVPGTYRINYYLYVEVADAGAGSLTLDFAWADKVGSKTLVDTALAYLTIDLEVTTGAYSAASGVVCVQTDSGTIAYSSSIAGSYNDSQYGLSIFVERLA